MQKNIIKTIIYLLRIIRNKHLLSLKKILILYFLTILQKMYVKSLRSLAMTTFLAFFV